MKTLITIIIPFYKKKKYIKQTIDSIINQSYQNFEIILIYDDVDRTDLPYIKKILQNVKRKKIIINKRNLGAGHSRNVGIRRAKGKYISFIDADDVWKKNKLKQQLFFMQNNMIKFSFTSYSIINENDLLIRSIKAKKNLNFKDLVKSCDIGLSTVMLKRDLLTTEKFPKIKTKEDYILWLKLAKKNVIMRGIDKNLVLWRKLDNSLSSSILQRIKDAFFVYNSFLKFNLIKSLYCTSILSLNFLKKRYL